MRPNGTEHSRRGKWTGTGINKSRRRERLRAHGKRQWLRDWFIALALILTGCVGSFEESRLAGAETRALASTPEPPSEYCQSLDSQRRWWGGIGQGAAVLAGTEGLVAIPVESDRIELGLAIGGAAMGAASVGALWLSNDAGDTWARDCAGGAR